MYVSTRFVGMQRGAVRYLFLYLSEDYVEEQRRITEVVAPALERFAADLEDDGALVRTFRGHEGKALNDTLKKHWSAGFQMALRQELPSLLAIDSDFDDFDPRRDKFLLLSLRALMDHYGNVDIFCLRDLLVLLVERAASDDIFANVEDYRRAATEEFDWRDYLQPQFQFGPLGVAFNVRAYKDRQRRQRSIGPY